MRCFGTGMRLVFQHLPPAGWEYQPLFPLTPGEAPMPLHTCASFSGGYEPPKLVSRVTVTG